MNTAIPIPSVDTCPPVAIIGGGPAGLMAATELTSAGCNVDLYDAMPSVGRKFLLAGIGGMNITHSEDFDTFCSRYAERENRLRPILEAFDPATLRSWCSHLGVETFIGTSGRVFPREMKAAPLLRAWLSQLRSQGLRLHPRHRWQGWDEHGQLQFATPDGIITRPCSALILALGGGSWKKLGSDGSWVSLLAARDIHITPLQPSNCGFVSAWSEHLRHHCSGSPLKSVTLTFTDQHNNTETRKGELILTAYGLEGSLIYAFSARLREMIQARGEATLYLDLCPDHTEAQLSTILARKPAKKSLGTYLKSSLKLDNAKTALLFEVQSGGSHDPALLKRIPITLTATRPMDEAISTAGGVPFEAMNAHLMLTALPGVFCAGEMLDWEAPTGGYLLTACLATGKHAGQGVLSYLQDTPHAGQSSVSFAPNRKPLVESIKNLSKPLCKFYTLVAIQ